MRTTLNLDADVAAEVERMRRDEGIGLSEVINRLARRAIAFRVDRHIYEPESVPLGLSVGVSTIGDVLYLLDDAR